MARIRIRYLVEKPGRNGPRFYWQPTQKLQKSGFAPRRLDGPRARAIDQAEALNAELDRVRAGAAVATDTKAPGSVAAIAAAYRAGPHFAGLAAATRRDYGAHLDAICAWCGDGPMLALTPRLVKAWHAKAYAQKPTTANYRLRVLSALWTWAVSEDLVTGANPCQSVRASSRHRKKGRPWTPEQVAHVCATAETMGRPSIALLIRVQCWLGQRQGDTLRLTRAAIRDGYITQSKTGAEVPLEWDPALAATIAEATRRHHNHTHLIICEMTGRPWAADTLRHEFAAIRAKAAETMPGCAGLILKDLRHTAVLQLAEAGCTEIETAAITGHSLTRVADILDLYLFRSRRLARNAQAKRRKMMEDKG